MGSPAGGIADEIIWYPAETCASDGDVAAKLAPLAVIVSAGVSPKYRRLLASRLLSVRPRLEKSPLKGGAHFFHAASHWLPDGVPFPVMFRPAKFWEPRKTQKTIKKHSLFPFLVETHFCENCAQGTTTTKVNAGKTWF